MTTATDNQLGHTLRVIFGNPVTTLAFAILVLLIFLALFGPSIVPYDPLATNLKNALQPPSAAHPFGTDKVGRDIFSRVIVATRLDLTIAFSAVLLSFAIGSVVGAMCGFWGGPLDHIVGRVVDVIMAFPLFVLAMALVAALGNEVQNIVYATAIINLPFYIRLTRAETMTRKSMPYVDAARVSGNSGSRILLRVMLPNAMPTLMVQLSVNLGWAILNAAGLSFIGLGIRPPTPEWGIMVAEGASLIISGYWWVALFPGLALTIAVFCFNLLGDGLRDIVDVRTRV